MDNTDIIIIWITSILLYNKYTIKNKINKITKFIIGTNFKLEPGWNNKFSKKEINLFIILKENIIN